MKRPILAASLFCAVSLPAFAQVPPAVVHPKAALSGITVNDIAVHAELLRLQQTETEIRQTPRAMYAQEKVTQLQAQPNNIQATR